MIDHLFDQKAAKTHYLFKNAALLDPRAGRVTPNAQVLVEGDRIKEVSAKPIKAGKATVIDCGGLTLMPGLIDCHVHVYLFEMSMRNLEAVPLTLMTARGAERLKGMIDRGFTTVRDTGGADWGIREAVEKGYFAGPRLFIAGRAIGPTGGHSDPRRRTDVRLDDGCYCCNAMKFQMDIVNGADSVRAAAREQMRQGADHIKIMVSGGVASPYDPLDSEQFTNAEVLAAVEEARAFGRYVCAHAYPASQIRRAVENGVRVIEHGNLVDAPTAKAMKKLGAYVVPTLVAYDAIDRAGAHFGMTPEMMAKNKVVLEQGLRSLEIFNAAGVPMGYGSDLIGALHTDQSKEFSIRAQVLAPLDIIRSATIVAAEVLRMPGELGEIIPGALAYMIAVDGNPLKDITVLEHQGARIPVIMKGGMFHKNRLS